MKKVPKESQTNVHLLFDDERIINIYVWSDIY